MYYKRLFLQGTVHINTCVSRLRAFKFNWAGLFVMAHTNPVEAYVCMIPW